MKSLSKKRTLSRMLCGLCLIALLSGSTTVSASEIENLENQSSDLEDQLSGINQEIRDIGEKIINVEEKIEETDGKISQTREQLSIARANETKQYQDMKLRIKYMYENDSSTMLEVLFASKSMQEFLNGVDFIRNISEYDRNKLDELHTLKETISDQERTLVKEQDSQKELQKQLDDQEAALRAKAQETSVSLSTLKAQINTLREEEARRAAEAARKAAEAEAAKKAAEEKKSKEAEQSGEVAEASKSETSGKPSVDYDMPGGDGVLTKHKGVNYYKGHRETWYSQRVLPGGGLNIPGRHVASDGTIRDKDNYICVASSDYPKGTVVETSLGMGKVYDSGCAHGTIDIYTDW